MRPPGPLSISRSFGWGKGKVTFLNDWKELIIRVSRVRLRQMRRFGKTHTVKGTVSNTFIDMILFSNTSHRGGELLHFYFFKIEYKHLLKDVSHYFIVKTICCIL